MRNPLLSFLLFLCIAGCTATPETVTVYAPGEDDDHYVNNAVLTYFKGQFYCMWQSSQTDEDAPDTHLVYSTSIDGRQWTAPRTLVPSTDKHFSSAGGWMVCGDTLVAFVNLLSDIQDGGAAYWTSSADGQRWSAIQAVQMEDGSPLDGILEQDIHVLPDGRLVGAAHFRPGLHARPIFSDDPSGRTGWHVGHIDMPDRGNQSQGIEPSLYLRRDNALVMLFRDQASSFRKLASISSDRGVSWTAPALTDIPDARSKQCAGNLPDGRCFYVGNPTPAKDRTTLAIAWSDDGFVFSDPKPLRTPDDLPPQLYPGKYKTPGYSYPKALVLDGAVYVSYSENKERIAITRIPLPRKK